MACPMSLVSCPVNALTRGGPVTQYPRRWTLRSRPASRHVWSVARSRAPRTGSSLCRFSSGSYATRRCSTVVPPKLRNEISALNILSLLVGLIHSSYVATRVGCPSG